MYVVIFLAFNWTFEESIGMGSYVHCTLYNEKYARYIRFLNHVSLKNVAHFKCRMFELFHLKRFSTELEIRIDKTQVN